MQGDSTTVGVPQMILLDLVRHSEDALRAVDQEDPEFKEMVQSVKEVGILNAPRVVHRVDPVDGTNFFLAIDGAHRITAARLAGLREIPATVVEGVTNEQILKSQIIGNIHVKETKPIEYSRALVRLLALDPLLTQAALCEQLGKSPSWLNDRLSLTKLKGSIQTLVNRSQIPLIKAYVMAELPEEEQDKWVEEALNKPQGEFVQLVKARVKELRAAAKAGREATIPQFVPTATFRKLADLKPLLDDTRDDGKKLADLLVSKYNLTNPSDAFAMGMKFVLQLDPDTLAEKKKKWDDNQAALAKKRADAKKAQEEKAAQKAAQKAATEQGVAATASA